MFHTSVTLAGTEWPSFTVFESMPKFPIDLSSTWIVFHSFSLFFSCCVLFYPVALKLLKNEGRLVVVRLQTFKLVSATCLPVEFKTIFTPFFWPRMSYIVAKPCLLYSLIFILVWLKCTMNTLHSQFHSPPPPHFFFNCVSCFKATVCFVLFLNSCHAEIII